MEPHALDAGQPLEAPAHPVGRRSVTFVDVAREQRRIDAEVWYPAATSDAPRSVYEIFPGVAFRGAVAQFEAPVAPGPWPLVVFSHGRTGTRITYTMVCEALAARGAVVVSADHPGDVLVDWLTGRHADDRTNETNRVGDAHLVLGAFLHGHQVLPPELVAAVDRSRVALMGHSYGAYTAYATAAGARGVDPHEHVGAVVGFQPYMRSMSDRLLGRVDVPSLLVVSDDDQVTPAHIDSDRAWELLPGRPSWKLQLAKAGHQAVSDIALYAELAPQVPDLPQIVRDYLMSTAEENRVEGSLPWRELQAHQVALTWTFLRVAFGDTTATPPAVDGLTLHRREPGSAAEGSLR